MNHQETRIRLSQCMIVKNEEKNIERALAWARELAWEQIVVDTGSEDDTIRLAQSLGAKVYFRPWGDDFSAAKNFALQQAKGDWIAFLDADEYLDAESTRRLAQLFAQIQGRGFDGIISDWEQVGEDGRIVSHGSQVRFFKRDPAICYQGRVHEQLVRLDGRPLKLANVSGQIRILHTGYQPEAVREKKKNERNRRILLEELKERPADAGLMGYIGDTWLSDGKKGEALSWYERALSSMPKEVLKGDQRAAVTLTKLLELKAEEKDVPGVEAIYQEAVSRLPEEPDFDYVIGLFYGEQEDFSKACRHLGEALGKRERFGTYNQAMRLEAEYKTVRGIYTKCLYRAGKMEEAARQGALSLSANPWDMSVLSVYMRALAWKKGEGDACLSELYQLYDRNSAKSRLFLYQCAVSSGLPLLASCIWYGMTEIEQAALRERGLDAAHLCGRKSG